MVTEKLIPCPYCNVLKLKNYVTKMSLNFCINLRSDFKHY